MRDFTVPTGMSRSSAISSEPSGVMVDHHERAHITVVATPITRAAPVAPTNFPMRAIASTSAAAPTSAVGTT